MEYAAGGELFERICNAGRFSEDEVTHPPPPTHPPTPKKKKKLLVNYS